MAKSGDSLVNSPKSDRLLGTMIAGFAATVFSQTNDKIELAEELYSNALKFLRGCENENSRH